MSEPRMRYRYGKTDGLEGLPDEIEEGVRRFLKDMGALGVAAGITVRITDAEGRNVGTLFGCTEAYRDGAYRYFDASADRRSFGRTDANDKNDLDQ